MNPDWYERGTNLYWLIIVGNCLTIAMIFFGYKAGVQELPVAYRTLMQVFVAPFLGIVCLGYIISIIIIRDLIWLIEHQNHRIKEFRGELDPMT